MNTITLIAIDPGKSGGIAIRLKGSYDVTLHKMPETPNDVCQLLKKAVFDSGGVEWVRVYMEEVRGYAGGIGQPGSAMFNFGRGVGIIEGFLYGAGIPFVLVPPHKWQMQFSIGTRGLVKVPKGVVPTKDDLKSIGKQNAKLKQAWKRKLKEVAQRLYPSHHITLDTSDALLLLEYARKQELQDPTVPPQPELSGLVALSKNLSQMVEA